MLVRVDGETFTEISIRLFQASDGLLEMTKRLAAMRAVNEADDASTLESVIEVNNQIIIMKHLLHAVLNANSEEEGKTNSNLPC